MSILEILDIKDHFLKIAASRDVMNELRHEMERRLDNLDDIESSLYDKPEIIKPDVIQLIRHIESTKIRCLQGYITAKQLYKEVDSMLYTFKTLYPEFDYMNDPVLNAYFA